MIKKQLEFYLEKEIDLNQFDVLFNVENTDITDLNNLYNIICSDIKKAKNINYSIFKFYLNKIVVKKIKKVFYNEKSLAVLLQLYQYDLKYALFFSMINFYKVKRVLWIY